MCVLTIRFDENQALYSIVTVSGTNYLWSWWSSLYIITLYIWWYPDHNTIWNSFFRSHLFHHCRHCWCHLNLIIIIANRTNCKCVCRILVFVPNDSKTASYNTWVVRFSYTSLNSYFQFTGVRLIETLYTPSSHYIKTCATILNS